MKKWRIMCVFFLFNFAGKVAVAQKRTETYSIKSLDGISSKVKVMHQVADTILKIAYLKDTVTIYDYWGYHEVHILNKKFIQLIYPVRIGSNEGLEKIILLCVDTRKLCSTLNVTYSLNYDYGERDHGLYNIKTTLVGSNKRNYKLKVHVRDDVYSKREPYSNYKYSDQSILNFDMNRDAFYSIKKNIYNDFITYDPKTNKRSKLSLKGNFPVIILGDSQYYLINKEWYVVGVRSELNKYSSYN